MMLPIYLGAMTGLGVWLILVLIEIAGHLAETNRLLRSVIATDDAGAGKVKTVLR